MNEPYIRPESMVLLPLILVSRHHQFLQILIAMDIIPPPAKVSRRVATVEGDCLARQMRLVKSRSDVAWYFEILVSKHSAL